VRTSPLILISCALLLGLTLSFYKIPFLFLFPFLLPLIFLLSFRHFLLFLLFFTAFYALGKYHFYVSPVKKWEREIRVILKVERVEPYYEGFKVLGRLDEERSLEFTTSRGDFRPGLICEVELKKRGWFERLNPYFPEERELLFLKGVEGLYRLKEGKVHCLEERPGLIEALRFRLFKFSETLSPFARGLFQALVLGVENQLPKAYLEELKSQGLYHQLAISGFNLAILYGLFYKALRFFFAYSPILRLGIPLKLLASILALPGAFLILVLSGFQPPALRAFFFLCLLVFSKALFRNTSSLNLLFLAGAILVLLDPTLPGNASFQLSFLATLALLLSDELFKNYFSFNELNPFIKKIFYSLFVSLIVSLFTLPIILYLAGEIPLATPLNNLIATPFWSFIFIPLSIFSALLSLIWDAPAKIIMEITSSIFYYYSQIPLLHLLFRPEIPVNLSISLFLFIFFLFCTLSAFSLRNFLRFSIILLSFIVFYGLLKELYQRINLVMVPRLFCMNVLVVKEGKDFYLIEWGDKECATLEKEIYLFPLLKKFGVSEIKGLLLLSKEHSQEEDDSWEIFSKCQKNFRINQFFTSFDLEEEKRLFKPGLEVLIPSKDFFILEFKGLTLGYERERRKEKGSLIIPEVAFSLRSERTLRKEAYFFFPKENYILELKESERRANFLDNLFFPLLPFYNDRGRGDRLYYLKER